jgi:hypothetical protein
MVGAAAMALTPAMVSATPGGTGSNTTADPTSLPSPTTGQPGADCEELIASGEGSAPGGSFNGQSAFGGFAGTKYAGEQPQNSKISTSVSQYDTGCLHGTTGPRSSNGG